MPRNLTDSRVMRKPVDKRVGRRRRGAIGEVAARDAHLLSARQLQSYVEGVGDAVYVLEAATGRIRNCNRRACRDVGYRRDELLRLSAGDIEVDLPRDTDAINRQALRHGKHPLISSVHRRKDGSTFPVEIRLVPLPSTHPRLLIAVVRDVTERRRADAELRRSAQIIDQIHDAIATTDLEGRITSWNKTAEDMFGYTSQEAQGRSIASLYLDDERDFQQSDPVKFLKARGYHHAELWARRKDGSRLCVDLSLAMLRDETRIPYGMIGYAKDITARKLGEEQLQFAEAVLANMTDTVFLVGADAGILYANEAATRMLGYTCQELLQMKVTVISPGVTSDGWHRHWQEIKQAGCRTFETLSRTKGGRVIPVEIVVTHLEIRGKEFHCVILRDIGERKRAEEALRDSETRYRSLFEQAAEAIVVYDPETTKMIDFNDAACSRLGYTREEFARFSLADIEAQETPVQIRRHVRHIVAAGELVFETRHRAKDGTVMDVEVWPKVVHIGGKKVVQVIWRDVTERKRTVAALQASELKYKSLVETTGTGYVILDKKGRVLDANTEYARMAGCRRVKDILGRSVIDWTAPYDRKRNAGEFRKCLRVGSLRGVQADHVGFGGRIVPIEIHATVLGDKVHPQILALCRDITRRRQNEETLRQYRDELEAKVAERTTRLRALANELTQTEQRERQRLAHVLHEDLQQRLVAMQYKVYGLKESLKDAAVGLTLDSLLHELADSVKITRTLTTRLAPPVLYELGLGAALDWLADEMHDQYGLTVRVTGRRNFELPSDELRAFAFDTVRELLLNVCKHSGTRVAEVRLGLGGQRHAVVEVRDRGRGMGKRDKTAEGFGLFSIRERAQALGLAFTIDSRSGKGTRARLELPRVRGAA